MWWRYIIFWLLAVSRSGVSNENLLIFLGKLLTWTQRFGPLKFLKDLSRKDKLEQTTGPIFKKRNFFSSWHTAESWREGSQVMPWGGHWEGLLIWQDLYHYLQAKKLWVASGPFGVRRQPFTLARGQPRAPVVMWPLQGNCPCPTLVLSIQSAWWDASMKFDITLLWVGGVLGWIWMWRCWSRAMDHQCAPLQLPCTPSLSLTPVKFPPYGLRSLKTQELQNKVDEMLTKDALELLPNKIPVFHSRFILVEKGEGMWGSGDQPSTSPLNSYV